MIAMRKLADFRVITGNSRTLNVLLGWRSRRLIDNVCREVPEVGFLLFPETRYRESLRKWRKLIVDLLEELRSLCQCIGELTECTTRALFGFGVKHSRLHAIMRSSQEYYCVGRCKN